MAANETNSTGIESTRESVARYWIATSYAALAFFLVVLALKLISAKTSDSARRVRVLLFGIALTFVPLLSLDAIARILNTSEDDLPAWLLGPVFPLVLSFPITIAYVTVVQRALDLGVVIRQSVQYALARRGVVALQILVSIIVIIVVAVLAGQTSFLNRLLITRAGMAAVLPVGFGANRVATWIDRRFFREAYNAEQILSRLAERVSSIIELRALLNTVAIRIAEALHISEIAVFLRDQTLYRPVFSLRYSNTNHVAFSERAMTIRELSVRKEPLRIHF